MKHELACYNSGLFSRNCCKMPLQRSWLTAWPRGKNSLKFKKTVSIVLKLYRDCCALCAWRSFASLLWCNFYLNVVSMKVFPNFTQNFTLHRVAACLFLVWWQNSRRKIKWTLVCNSLNPTMTEHSRKRTWHNFSQI